VEVVPGGITDRVADGATGDADAFSAWAASAQRRLLRTAVLLTGDHQRAEDLVQEALVKVALRWRRLRDGRPEAYARQVIVRDNISWWRKHRREVLVEPPEGRPVDLTDSTERRLLLDRALAALTPRQRAVVVLRYYDDLTEQATADALGVAVGTVKSQTHLALRRLAEAAPELAEYLGEEVR
jgi:RNA polymerase sigma-70 factor (sigma-E family)